MDNDGNGKDGESVVVVVVVVVVGVVVSRLLPTTAAIPHIDQR
jgi:hypothetical protein